MIKRGACIFREEITFNLIPLAKALRALGVPRALAAGVTRIVCGAAACAREPLGALDPDAVLAAAEKLLDVCAAGAGGRATILVKECAGNVFTCVASIVLRVESTL